jgi:hemolysin activation/secretion protein
MQIIDTRPGQIVVDSTLDAIALPAKGWLSAGYPLVDLAARKSIAVIGAIAGHAVVGAPTRRNPERCSFEFPMRRICGAVVLVMASAAWAQTPSAPPSAPGAGDISRDVLRVEPSSSKAAPLSAAADALPPAEPGAAVVDVTDFAFEGMSLVAQGRLKSLMRPYVGQRLTLGQIEVAIQLVVGLYRELGWLASVYLPLQEIKDGVVRVAVIEGKLESVAVQGKGDPANNEFLRALVTNRLKVGEPVAIAELERGLLLAQEVPGVSATGLLQPGKEPGGVGLLISVEPKLRFATSLDARNWGGRATGQEQLSANFEYYPNRGYGVQVAVTTLVSEGVRSIGGSVSRYVGNDGLRVGLNASHVQYKLIGDFKPLKVLGDSNVISINAAYPLLRSEGANLRLTGVITQRELRDYILDTELRNRGITLVEVGLQGDSRDTWGGGGLNSASLSLKGGHTKLRNPIDILADQAGPQVQGGFTGVVVVAGRSQVLTPKNYLNVVLYGQWSNKNLDSSERFTLGGASGVRGYPSGEATGDLGYQLKVELQREFSGALSGFAFMDSGRIRVDSKPWWGSSPTNTYSLHSAGLGVRWSNADGWRAEGVLALPLQRNPSVPDSSRHQDGSSYGPRLWVRLIKSF